MANKTRRGGYHFWLGLVVTWSLSACGDRTVQTATDGGVDGAAGRDGLAAVGDGPRVIPGQDGGAVPPGSCVIAIRVDDCCTSPFPTFAQHLQQDPCVVPYPNKEIPEVCRKKWPVNCDLVDCAWGRPPSRLVGAVPGGGCQWLDECATPDDCVVAWDARRCCPCEGAYPRALLSGEKCLIPIYQSAVPEECLQGCPEVTCAPCPPIAQLGCADGEPAGPRTCVPGPAW